METAIGVEGSSTPATNNGMDTTTIVDQKQPISNPASIDMKNTSKVEYHRETAIDANGSSTPATNDTGAKKKKRKRKRKENPNNDIDTTTTADQNQPISNQASIDMKNTSKTEHQMETAIDVKGLSTTTTVDQKQSTSNEAAIDMNNKSKTEHHMETAIDANSSSLPATNDRGAKKKKRKKKRKLNPDNGIDTTTTVDQKQSTSNQASIDVNNKSNIENQMETAIDVNGSSTPATDITGAKKKKKKKKKNANPNNDIDTTTIVDQKQSISNQASIDVKNESKVENQMETAIDAKDLSTPATNSTGAKKKKRKRKKKDNPNYVIDTTTTVDQKQPLSTQDSIDVKNESTTEHQMETAIDVKVESTLSINDTGTKKKKKKRKLNPDNGTDTTITVDQKEMKDDDVSFIKGDEVSRREKKLLVFDVNGLLADIVPSPCPRNIKADKYIPAKSKYVPGKSIFKRPYLNDFLRFCFEKFHVGIWSSRTKPVLDPVVDFLLHDFKKNLVFVWDASKCTKTQIKTLENKQKPIVLKEIWKIWNEGGFGKPWVKGSFHESNTLLLDDSPYKALLNPKGTTIFPPSYSYKDRKDNSLGPNGDIRNYLEGLADSDDVKTYVEQHPFGQQAIDQTHPQWAFYSNVLNCQSVVQAKKHYSRRSSSNYQYGTHFSKQSQKTRSYED